MMIVLKRVKKHRKLRVTAQEGHCFYTWKYVKTIISGATNPSGQKMERPFIFAMIMIKYKRKEEWLCSVKI